MKNFKFIALLLITVFFIVSCGDGGKNDDSGKSADSGKYSDFNAVMNDMNAETEKFVKAINDTEESDTIVKAITEFSTESRKLSEKIQKITEKYPEITEMENAPPELEDAFNALTKSQDSLYEAFNKIMNFADDPAVLEALANLQK